MLCQTSSPRSLPLAITASVHPSATRKVVSLREAIRQKGVRAVALKESAAETTREEQMRIIVLRDNARWNWSQIGRELHISRTYQRIYECWKQDNTPSNRKRPGIHVTFDDGEKARLEAVITRDAPYPTPQQEAMFGAYDTMKRRTLLQRRYNKRVLRK